MRLMSTLMHDLLERDDQLSRLLRDHDHDPGIEAYRHAVHVAGAGRAGAAAAPVAEHHLAVLLLLGELDHSMIDSVDEVRADVFPRPATESGTGQRWRQLTSAAGSGRGRV